MNSSTSTIPFDTIARLPADGDNVAIATRRLEADLAVERAGTVFTLSHSVLEGHRFAIRTIAKGDELLSWGLPFGIARREVQPGEYVCNEKILKVLAERDVDLTLPNDANFDDCVKKFVLDEQHFTSGVQVSSNQAPSHFEGYRRAGPRGVGTRNFVVILATTSRSAAFAEALCRRFDEVREHYPNVDGVVPVTHTEGGGGRVPNNLDFVMRTLAGFMVHPNVGAVLAADYGSGPFGNDTLEAFMRDADYPLDHVPHAFFSVDGNWDAALERAEATVGDWLPQVNAAARSHEPVSSLKIALQCGGSDAFSGISGNALAGWVAKQVIRQGGSANLAETDELIGAEPYVLSNVRDAATARTFLDKIEVFKERARHHGTSAEGNPSGGNNFRGLYNITLKSIGAARKKDPEVRLDHVIDYAAPMAEPGYYFMDSPGNDLESIAGQVASGCNLIFFITGNGSITNFPFVPTLKLVTTTGRFELLANEMDVNAGRYNDGLAMDDLGQETFELARGIASGQRSKGEVAGHAQVSIWRDWPQTDASQVEQLRDAPAPVGAPLPTIKGAPPNISFSAFQTERGYASEQIGLVMPTSLCSGQVARLIADHLNARKDPPLRYVALAHTEGCGSANGDGLFLQTLAGHLQHRFVRRAVLLEHGCERTHNDAIRHYLGNEEAASDRLGWASVQLDGGIEKVRDKVANWFDASLREQDERQLVPVGVEELRLGLVASGPLPDATAHAFAELVKGVVSGGGTVVIPANAGFASSKQFKEGVLAVADDWQATLAYGQPAIRAGLHVMEAPTDDPAETLTGLGGAGAEIMIAHVGDVPLQAHPMIPLMQTTSLAEIEARFGADLDLVLSGDTTTMVNALLARIAEVSGREYQPKLFNRGVVSFQLTRGPLGLSL